MRPLSKARWSFRARAGRARRMAAGKAGFTPGFTPAFAGLPAGTRASARVVLWRGALASAAPAIRFVTLTGTGGFLPSASAKAVAKSLALGKRSSFSLDRARRSTSFSPGGIRWASDGGASGRSYTTTAIRNHSGTTFRASTVSRVHGRPTAPARTRSRRAIAWPSAVRCQNGSWRASRPF